MSILMPFVRAEMGGAFGLTSSECSTIDEAAYHLIAKGFACGVGAYENDGITYSYVLDRGSNSYTIGRHAGAYFLVDPDLGLLAVNRKLDRVVDIMKSILAANLYAYRQPLERRQG